MTDNKKDQRRYHRFNAAGGSEVVLLDESGKTMRRAGESLNMSVGGLLISTNEKLPLGATVLLKLNLDEPAERKFEAFGRISRISERSDGGYDIAVTFEAVEGKESAELL
ncbi:MAG TPA: PilZ domain-containing protein [Acidobacteriota bacterium]|nr:PilZ domain-containing protein [Acidobacteriota bacterium]